MKSRAKECPRSVRYAFWLIVIFLLLWILFFGQNSFWNTMLLHRKVDKLEQEAQYLKAVNDSLSKENARLKTDPEAAEKAAREQFGLTKPDEKVFRFVPAREDK
ncbi:MAG: septum formation initiator family protein [Candidatus Cloacimonetes bacterium]|nr:septum formation initiator family protein [Candidatus Cloacimonadota bacterium]MDY0337136.1 septum formation initiator family protein [Candidatus Cloacimonadaceae bacterium]MCB5268831.1 septum formation initiator family protein [Candidatus Cloacimonadota bacterium]MCK9334577.1 septum formation initiator family protein [Candidatus Cloacimonadota bacterium]MDD2544123.1 septum formation initiator family protein [Candidatus Cloacimonadota bacterium]